MSLEILKVATSFALIFVLCIISSVYVVHYVYICQSLSKKDFRAKHGCTDITFEKSNRKKTKVVVQRCLNKIIEVIEVAGLTCQADPYLR